MASPTGPLTELGAAVRATGHLGEGEPIPESIGSLTRLSCLELRNNRLTALPESLGNLRSLTHLDLRANRLLALPDSIGELANLEKLDLRWNKLAALPAWIDRLEQRGCVVLL